MFRHLAILVACFIASAAATAQGDPTVWLLSAEKTLSYRTEAGAWQKNIHPGAVILKANTLKVPRKATATLYHNGTFVQLKKGKHRLSDVWKNATTLRSLGFDEMFESYLAASVSLAQEANGLNTDWARLIDPKTGGDGWGTTDPKKAKDGWGTTDPKKAKDGWGTTDPKKAKDGWGTTDPKKAKDGWGVTDPKKAKDGWGGQGKRIHPIMPFGNLLPSGPVVFSWSKPEGSGGFALKIHDAAGNLVHEAVTQDTFAVVDISKAPYMDGAHFVWQVFAERDGEKLESERFEIAISNSDAWEAAFAPLKRSKLYPTADPALRQIMEAVALERAEWFYPAQQRYIDLKAKYPENNMARIMYATFWMRYGLLTMAHAAVK